MVFYSDRVSSAEDDEYIYVAKKDKEEDTEMQMLTPIMLESMIDLHSPPNSPDIFRVLKETDKTDRPDDATEMTTESFSDILLPTFETPPRITTNALDDDDTSEVSFESYGLGENTSPRNITSTGNVSNYPLRIPFDVLYEGEVIFATSHVAKRIHLQPRRSAQADSIFVPKAVTQDYPIYAEYALADSMTSFDDNDGAEECKDDDGGVSSYEEGFAYMLGDRFKEEQYWGDYDGHYGSHDFEEDGRGSADYALDHASVQEVSTAASGPSTRYEPFAQQPSAQSFLENLHEFFTASCFSCTNDFTLQPIRNRGSNHRSHKNSGSSFEPADYGVSPRSEGRFF
jgi:hypothetical protein